MGTETKTAAAPKFSDLQFNERPGHPMGIQAMAEFPNGYAASVIQGPHSYGGPQGFYELAVMHGGDLVYDTPVTNDVEGWLSEDDVSRLLGEIAALPARERA